MAKTSPPKDTPVSPGIRCPLRWRRAELGPPPPCSHPTDYPTALRLGVVAAGIIVAGLIIAIGRYAHRRRRGWLYRGSRQRRKRSRNRPGAGRLDREPPPRPGVQRRARLLTGGRVSASCWEG